MDLLTHQQLIFLSQAHQRCCVSIFLPTYRAGKEVTQNPVRLKNLLKTAEEQLVANCFSKRNASELLSPARQLERRSSFWRNQSHGLALFLSPGFFQYFRLPIPFPELSVTADRFEVKPLLPLFMAGGRFYLLALSLKNVHLFQGTPFTLDELDLQGVPRSIQESLKYDIRERPGQAHTGSGAPRRRKAGAVFHGQGVGVDDSKERILQHFQNVAKGIERLLRDRQIPAVLAGVKELFPIYRQASAYPNLLEDGIEGNPELYSTEDLHQAAWRIASAYFEQSRKRAISRFADLISSGKASADLGEILRSVYQGRVDFILLPDGAQRWGKYDPESGNLISHESALTGDEDLLNLLTIQTILHRGGVYSVSAQEVPDHAPAAAAFRY